MGAQPCGQRIWLRDLRAYFILVFTMKPKCQGLCPMGEWSVTKRYTVSVRKAQSLRRCLSKGLVGLLYDTRSQTNSMKISFFTKFKQDHRSEGPWSCESARLCSLALCICGVRVRAGESKCASLRLPTASPELARTACA